MIKRMTSSVNKILHGTSYPLEQAESDQNEK